VAIAAKQLEETQFDLIDIVEYFRLDANRKIPSSTRSELGQFLTGISVAKYMTSLFDSMNGNVNLLDPGAGVGSLTAAFIQEATERNARPESIKTTSIEIEGDFLEYLRDSLSECRKYCAGLGIHLGTEIINEDFIDWGSSLLPNNQTINIFTHAILNPPYKKILSSSSHRKSLRQIGIETSNLYAAFVAIVIKLLQPKGELVAIIPHSFCNGPYFKNFREFLLSEVSITHIHVFESRNKAFHDDEVLQENIVIHAVKGVHQRQVHISSSYGHF